MEKKDDTFLLKKDVYECSCIFKKLGICKSYRILKKGNKILSKEEFKNIVFGSCSKKIREKINKKEDEYIENYLVYSRKNKLLKLNEKNISNKWFSKIWKR